MRIRTLDYRYAGAVLGHEDFRSARDELLRVLDAAPVPLLNPHEPDPRRGGVKHRARGGQRAFLLPVDQKALNTHLDGAFGSLGWAVHPNIV